MTNQFDLHAWQAGDNKIVLGQASISQCQATHARTKEPFDVHVLATDPNCWVTQVLCRGSWRPSGLQGLQPLVDRAKYTGKGSRPR